LPRSPHLPEHAGRLRERQRYEARARQRSLDFTDDTVVLPILKWLRITGPINAQRIIEITNAVSLRFFDANLREGSKPSFDGAFSELTVETNAAAQF
jgi:hypothetical protein